jgi:hypothetical protein
MEIDVLLQPYSVLALEADNLRAVATILNAEFEGDHLRVELKDGRIIFLPSSWLPIYEAVLSNPSQPITVSPDGMSLVWPEIPAYLHLKDMLSGGEACDRCWYRVSYFK